MNDYLLKIAQIDFKIFDHKTLKKIINIFYQI